jgi:cytochrome c2
MKKLITWILVAGTVLTGIILAIVVVVLIVKPGESHPVWTVPDGNPKMGRQVIITHGCHACHVIDGIREATGRVGPKLEDIEKQIYIGGVLPNSPENMIRWIVNPDTFSPGTAMPDLEVTPEGARDITAYLFGIE